MTEKELELYLTSIFNTLKDQSHVLMKMTQHMQNMSFLLNELLDKCDHCENIVTWTNGDHKKCDRHFFIHIAHDETQKKCWEESQHSDQIRQFEELFSLFRETKTKH